MTDKKFRIIYNNEHADEYWLSSKLNIIVSEEELTKEVINDSIRMERIEKFANNDYPIKTISLKKTKYGDFVEEKDGNYYATVYEKKNLSVETINKITGRKVLSFENMGDKINYTYHKEFYLIDLTIENIKRLCFLYGLFEIDDNSYKNEKGFYEECIDIIIEYTED